MVAIEEVVEAGLRYWNDQDPGITRHGKPQHFTYRDAHGQVLKDDRSLDRIAKLVIPPAWADVVICPYPRGYLQVVGRDAKGRKQPIYHADWRAHREETKFEHLSTFGEALPAIRKRMATDLCERGLSKSRVVAAVIDLLQSTLIRVGNREYALKNDSFGLTTMQMRHLRVGSELIQFRFKGKSGKVHDITYRDRRLARLIKQIQDLPGQSIFQYLRDDGSPAEVTSGDVNSYLQHTTGGGFTAKDFRTWAASVETLRLRREGVPASIPAVVKQVAQLLGNTPTVCRKSYIHPKVLDVDAEVLRTIKARSTPWMDADERRLLTILTP